MDTDEEAALSVLAGDLPAQADDDEMGEELTLYEMDDIEAVDDDDPFSPTDFPVRSRTGPSLLSRLHLKSRMIQAGVCLALVVVVVVIAVAITVGVTYQLSPHDSTKKEKEANQNPSFDPDDHDLLVDMFIDFGLDTINEEAMRAAIMVRSRCLMPCVVCFALHQCIHMSVVRFLSLCPCCLLLVYPRFPQYCEFAYQRP